MDTDKKTRGLLGSETPLPAAEAKPNLLEGRRYAGLARDFWAQKRARDNIYIFNYTKTILQHV